MIVAGLDGVCAAPARSSHSASKAGRRGRCFIEALKVFFVAQGGDAKSLAVLPATVTHSRLSEEARREAGVKPEQIRVSIGTEDPDDLLWDIEQALKHSR